MNKTRWPTLTHEYPENLAKHASTLQYDFRKVRHYLTKSGSDEVPKYLFKLLRDSYTELNKNIQSGLSKRLLYVSVVSMPSKDVETAMHQAAATMVKTHMVTIEDQFAAVQHYIAETRAKRVPKRLFEIISKSVNGLLAVLKTRTFVEDEFKKSTREKPKGESQATRVKGGEGAQADPMEHSRKDVVTDGTPSEQEVERQNRPVTPAHERMHAAMATIANGSVGELVIPDSTSGTNKSVPMTRANIQWPPDEDDSDETDEEEPMNESSKSEDCAIQSVAQYNQQIVHSIGGVGDYAKPSNSSEEAPGVGFMGTRVNKERSHNLEVANISPQVGCTEETLFNPSAGHVAHCEEGQKTDIIKEAVNERKGIDKIVGEEFYIVTENSLNKDHGDGESKTMISKDRDEEMEDKKVDGEPPNEHTMSGGGSDEQWSHEVAMNEEKVDGERVCWNSPISEAHAEIVKAEGPDTEEANFHIEIARLRTASPLRTPPAMTQTASQIQSRGWMKNFLNLSPAEVGTYGVTMFNILTCSIDLRGPDKKIEAARHLMAQNATVIDSPDVVRYMCWSENKFNPKSTFASVNVEFATAEKANLAIRSDLIWNREIHTCRKPVRLFILRQCCRCYAYGHTSSRCSAAVRCGRCAGEHLIAHRRSDVYKCPVCSGAHPAYWPGCPVRQVEQKRLDNDRGLQNLFYQVTESPEPEIKAEPLPDLSTTVEPSSLTALMEGERSYGDEGQISPSSYCASSCSHHKQSPQLQPIVRSNNASPSIDPKTILEQLEHLKAVVTELLPTTGASAATAPTRKRKALDPLSANAKSRKGTRKCVKS